MIKRLVFFAIFVPVVGGWFYICDYRKPVHDARYWFFIRMSLFLFIMNLLIDIYIRITGKHK